ncbi:MAG: SGNH/GDSL hydrolase family protein [Clostridiales bacterium]|jgi:lysophospholipase L1-like esterase|nr:SGNH/GDSL hydrolase family protein [Clostridiales bacterium]
MIEKGARVLFQGDSITDCGRDREKDTLGGGYPYFAAALFQSMYPELEATFINRGISGNRTADLVKRWDEDCLALKPDVLSILIGINDTWRGYDSNDPTSADDYYANYKEILTRTRDALGDISILILEPFVMPYPADRLAWRTDLDPKIQKARQLAREFNAVYIPLDGIFAQNSVAVPPSFWAADGVHPTAAGHALIAKCWLDAVEY